jgi:small subunit ribosomal protein S20
MASDNINSIIIRRNKDMANIKSAKKRILVSKKREMRNKSVKSRVKTIVKKVEAAIEAGNKAEAEEALKVAISEISKAASKGIYHKNTAARKISRLTVAVNKIGE